MCAAIVVVMAGVLFSVYTWAVCGDGRCGRYLSNRERRIAIVNTYWHWIFRQPSPIVESSDLLDWISTPIHRTGIGQTY